MSPRPSTSNSQTRFTAWLHLGSPNPAQIAAISDCFTAQAEWPWAKHRWELTLAYTSWETLGPAHPVDSYRPQGAPPPCPAQLILHRGQRLVLSSYSQSLQLTGLGKSLPLICQQQPRVNYKSRVYSAHTKGAPQVPSMGDGEAVPPDPTGHLLH